MALSPGPGGQEKQTVTHSGPLGVEWTVKDLIASQARVPGAGATPESSCLSLWAPLTHEVHKAGADSSDLRVLSAGTRGAQSVRPLDLGQPLRHSLTGMLESLPQGSTVRIMGGGTACVCHQQRVTAAGA